MDTKLTYNELIDRLAADTGESKTALQSFLPELVKVIREGLERDKKSRVSKFGIFELHDIPATTGTNPRTGETIDIAAHQRIAFKPNTAIETLVNLEFADLKSRPVPRVSESPTVPAPPPKAGPAPHAAAAPVAQVKRGFGLMDAVALIAVLIAGTVTVQKLGLFEMPIGGDTFMEYISDLVEDDETEVVDAEAEPGDAAAEETYPYTTAATDTPPTPSDNIPVGSVEAGVEDSETKKPVAIEPVAKRSKKPVPAPKIVPANKLVRTRQPVSSEPLAFGDQHIVTNNEGLWDLAERYYGEPLLWVNIYRVNRERLLDPDGLAKGMHIVVPALMGTAANLTREDSINIANGAYQAHRAYKRAGSKHADYYLRMSNRFREP